MVWYNKGINPEISYEGDMKRKRKPVNFTS
jgi:hypothetical protein